MSEKEKEHVSHSQSSSRFAGEMLRFFVASRRKRKEEEEEEA